MGKFASITGELQAQLDLLNTISKFNIGFKQRFLFLNVDSPVVEITKFQFVLLPSPQYEYGLIFRRVLDRSDILSNFLNNNSDLFPHFSLNMFVKTLERLQSCKSIRRIFQHRNLILYPLLENEDLIAISNILLGLNLGNVNIKILRLSDGIDFLGWTFKVIYSGEISVYPSVYNWANYKANVKRIIKAKKSDLVEKLYKVRCLSVYWRKYNQLCDLASFRNKFYHLKKWVNLYLKKTTSLAKAQRTKILNYIF